MLQITSVQHVIDYISACYSLLQCYFPLLCEYCIFINPLTETQPYKPAQQ